MSFSQNSEATHNIHLVLLHDPRRWEGGYFCPLSHPSLLLPLHSSCRWKTEITSKRRGHQRFLSEIKLGLKTSLIIPSLPSLISILETKGHEGDVSHKCICCQCELHRNEQSAGGSNSTLPTLQRSYLEVQPIPNCFRGI